MHNQNLSTRSVRKQEPEFFAHCRASYYVLKIADGLRLSVLFNSHFGHKPWTGPHIIITNFISYYNQHIGALHWLPASASDLISVTISQRGTWLVRGVRGREKQHAGRSAQTQAALLQTKAGHTASSDAQTQQACAQQIDTTWQAHSNMTFDGRG